MSSASVGRNDLFDRTFSRVVAFLDMPSNDVSPDVLHLGLLLRKKHTWLRIYRYIGWRRQGSMSIFANLDAVTFRDVASHTWSRSWLCRTCTGTVGPCLMTLWTLVRDACDVVSRRLPISMDEIQSCLTVLTSCSSNRSQKRPLTAQKLFRSLLMTAQARIAMAHKHSR